MEHNHDPEETWTRTTGLNTVVNGGHSLISSYSSFCMSWSNWNDFKGIYFSETLCNNGKKLHRVDSVFDNDFFKMCLIYRFLALSGCIFLQLQVPLT